MKKALSIVIIFSIFSCQNISEEERFNNLDPSERKELVEELQTMVENDQLLRTRSGNLNKNSSFYKHKNDSLWKIIDSIDLANTERLIEITRKYGFPNVDRIEAPVPAWLIFQHAPEEYHNELNVLLEDEKNAKRFPPMEYAMVTWHLNGRKGPFLPFTEVTQEAIDSLEKK